MSDGIDCYYDYFRNPPKQLVICWHQRWRITVVTLADYGGDAETVVTTDRLVLRVAAGLANS